MTEADSGQHFATRARVEKKSLTFFREAGRGKALVHINNLVKFNPGLILLMGEEGSGRRRVLKQFADSLKGKPGKICILDRAIKNDNQLYSAIAEGFGIDHIPGDSAKSLQNNVQTFLETNINTIKPLIIALDDVQRCSLAMLEALIALQKKFRQMSLILIGDHSLQKMLERLQGGKTTANSVLLAPLDAREIRQYVNWRLPFQVSDADLNNIINLTRGNLALLEQEALKKEANYEQQSSSQSGGGIRLSRKLLLSVLLAFVVVGGVGSSYFLFPEQFSQRRITEVLNQVKGLTPAEMFSSNSLSQVKAWLHLGDDKKNTIEAGQESVLSERSNDEWVERQMTLLDPNNVSETPSSG